LDKYDYVGHLHLITYTLNHIWARLCSYFHLDFYLTSCGNCCLFSGGW